jgi:tetratricopeptide (TPR) repeat protein
VDERERSLARAERACYLARAGQFSVARQIAAELRKEAGNDLSLALGIWLGILDGLTAYFELLDPLARNKLRAAQALAIAGKDHDLAALASAWLAHVELDLGNFEAFRSALQMYFDRATHSGEDAALRAHMTMANALMHVGRRVEAQLDYEIARRYAVNIGDEIAIGALMYNRAAFALSFVRFQRVAGIAIDEDWFKYISMEVESAKTFQFATGVAALTSQMLCCYGQAMLLLGRHAEAMRVLEEVLANEDGGTERISWKVTADLALCLCQSGQLQRARELFTKLRSTAPPKMDADDEAITMDALGLIAGFLGECDFEFGSAARKRAAVERHLSSRLILSNYLSSIRR